MFLGIDKIYKLKDIALEYPSKVANHLMKRLKISKKIRDELQTELDYTFGTDESNAFEVFMFLTQFLLTSEEKNIELENKIVNISNLSAKEFSLLDSKI